MSDKTISEPASLSEERLRELIREADATPVDDDYPDDVARKADCLSAFRELLSRRSQGNDAAGDDDRPSKDDPIEVWDAYYGKLSTPTASPSRQAADAQAQGEVARHVQALKATVSLLGDIGKTDTYDGDKFAALEYAIALLQRQPSEVKP
jgi:hypothetical protein